MIFSASTVFLGATILSNCLMKLNEVAFTEKYIYGDLFCKGYALTGDEMILIDNTNGNDLIFPL